MEQLVRWVATAIGIEETTAGHVIASVIVVIALWLVRLLVLRIAWRRTEDPKARYTWRKASGYIAAAAGLLILGRIWIGSFRSIATFAGLVSAGLAIALRDVVANFAAWIFIVWRRPFKVGDRIEIGTHIGDVIDIRAFQFTLLEVRNWVDADQSTGRLLHVPNGLIMTQPLANYSQGFQYVWHEVPVLITFESDWKRAKELLQSIATEHAERFSKMAEERIKEASKRYLIFYPTLTPTVYTAVRESGVLLTIRYLCRARNRRGSEQAMWESILEAFGAEPSIEFAYPTTRFYSGSGTAGPPPPGGGTEGER